MWLVGGVVEVVVDPRLLVKPLCLLGPAVLESKWYDLQIDVKGIVCFFLLLFVDVQRTRTYV